MRPRDDQDRRIIHIGPDADPAGWTDDPEDGPPFLIKDARERPERAEQADRETAEVARRLVYAFVVVVLLAVVFHVAMPAFGLHLPAIVPILCYLAILAGAVLTARDNAR
jgi:uncharacterized membrane protein YbhN (UPF0104 family)